jgi:hypothetical protein
MSFGEAAREPQSVISWRTYNISKDELVKALNIPRLAVCEIELGLGDNCLQIIVKDEETR